MTNYQFSIIVFFLTEIAFLLMGYENPRAALLATGTAIVHGWISSKLRDTP